jgi:hypothetical protein
MRGLKRWWWIPPALLVAAVIAFVIWGSTPLGPMPEALAALQSDGQVQVQASPWLTFRPAQGEPTTGLIIYPGGRVDYRSYAPTARAVAARGYLVVIARMPLSLAVLAPGRAGSVIAHYPQIQHWAVGGHSLGGAMAANFVYGNPSAAQGLVFWAAYPAGSNDLSSRSLSVVSVYGTRDGQVGQIAASRSLLPASTQWVAIEGGNHAQFGWYGPQPGDNEAAISRDEQQRQTVEATVAFLKSLTP